MQPEIADFFHEPTNTVSYVVADPETGACAVIDSVLDYDPDAARTAHRPRRPDRGAHPRPRPAARVDPRDPRPRRPPLRRALPARPLGGRIGIGARITTVQHTFAAIYNAERGFARDGSQFDHLFEDGETFAHRRRSRRSTSRRPATPRPAAPTRSATTSSSATPSSCPTTAPRAATSPAATRGPCTARSAASSPTSRRPCSGSATTTRRPAATNSPGAPPSAPSASRTRRSATASARTSSCALREARDATLGTPRLLIPSIQVNMRAGNLPPPEDNGTRYLKVPIERDRPPTALTGDFPRPEVASRREAR